VTECFFWYRLTCIVLEKGPLNRLLFILEETHQLNRKR